MTILVTRPSPAGEELVGRLLTLGKMAYSFPLIEFSPGRQLAQLPSQLAALPAESLVFVLSQNVIHFAGPLLRQSGIDWPKEHTWFAIGRTTALTLHAASHLTIHYPQDRETSEVLLQLPELQHIQGKQALILRGNGGRELLGETLQERGAKVTFCECYQRNEVNYNSLEEAWRWYERQISIIVVTSGEMLQQLYTLIPVWYRENWLLQCQLLVVSERLASLARHLGWHNILVADNADNDALLRALQLT
ncbi:uroporphyrinogen-III synthase [Klebsiella sp. BIGb0407]|uniref:uroporphyrinogen-III synthase n=1 Tax=Klebsiella sp. BIGb0407 TaxID=2940603 RepID=UPI00216935B1|nr:uroporphyrinogen-III synthase [Klebsiella sp. BIGb0407]MCS3434404.1 uroporphyrinogen-III synthase [Klebsiella sp. BIGb0407]